MPLNSWEFEIITDDTCSGAFPVFVTFNVRPELFVPVGVLGNERVDGEIVIAGCGGEAPVPLTLITLVVVLLLISKDALRAPTALGEKATEMLHVPSRSIAGGQLLELLKSLASDPTIAMDEILRTPAPVFRTTTSCAALDVANVCVAKLRLLGVTVNFGGGGDAPAPLNETVLNNPLNRTSRVAERAPIADGLKLTLIKQAPLRDNGNAQSLEAVKSDAFVPEIETDET